MKKVAILGHQEVTKVVADRLLAQNIIPTIVSLSYDVAKNIKEYVNLARYCTTRNLEFHQVCDYSLKSKEITEYFLSKSFDIVFVVGWSRLIPSSLLEIQTSKFIGWHGGPFAPPRCRGRAVVNWSILNNDTDFFVYTMILGVGVDDGDILNMSSVSIDANETAQSLYLKCAFLLAEMLTPYTSPKFTFQSTPQSLTSPTYLPKRTPVDGEIDWQLPSKVIERLVRALSFPFPPAWTKMRDEIVKVYRARALDVELPINKKIGTVHYVTESGELVVVTGRGLLLIEAFEIENELAICSGDRFGEADNKLNASIKY